MAEKDVAETILDEVDKFAKKNSISVELASNILILTQLCYLHDHLEQRQKHKRFWLF
jgi:hypothetical protein